MRTDLAPAIRDVRLGPAGVVVEHSPDGSMRLRSPHALGPYPARLTDRLDYWAREAPDRVFLAQRAPGGDWRTITYARFNQLTRRVAQALLNRGLSAERPVLILSGNDIEHALMAWGAMYAGILHAPVSPAYSLVSTHFTRLHYIFKLMTPGLVFIANPAQYRRVIDEALPPDVELVTSASLEDLASTPVTHDVDRAHAAIRPDTVAKILFTSGSTGMPKATINTERMLTSNQEMLRNVLAFMGDEPPVICDWLPWNHTFGGNHNIGLVLYNGGTLYIDEGRPVPGPIEATVRNLREIAPTVYFNVPKGYEMLVPFLRNQPDLRDRFFSRLRLLFYAAAGLSQHVWDALDDLAVQACGERVLMLTGLGATESAPFALCAPKETSRSGVVGLPVPGVELKLAPVAGKLEARLRGPNITPGYWRQEDLTRAAFDEEGFYRMGDAVRFIDENAPAKGLLFDGRIVEDFKLSTGTRVSTGPLRAKFLAHFAPWVQDVVIAGEDRDDITALVFPDIAVCRRACPAGMGEAPASAVVSHAPVCEVFRALLERFAALSTGSSNRVARVLLLSEMPSIDSDEVTDKGTLNQRAVLRNRAALVEELYADPPSARIISI